MKKILFILLILSYGSLLHSGTVEKTFYFGKYNIESSGAYKILNFNNTMLHGIPGEPLLPWQDVVMMLPPGECALSIDIIREGEFTVPGSFLLRPAQPVQPVASDRPADFMMNQRVYSLDKDYPENASGHLLTQYLAGYSFALSSFTPVQYNPAKRKLTCFSKVTVRITTGPGSASVAAMKNLAPEGAMKGIAQSFAMNPGMDKLYPRVLAPSETYDYLIISPVVFKTEFQSFIGMQAGMGISARVVCTDSISATTAGYDMPEKIRNFIIAQRQGHNIQYVLLAGNPPLVPCRGFYCYVNSGGTPYTDSNIPADLYYSGLDGTFDANGNHVYGELTDNPDLLPDIAVARFTVNDTAELRNMIGKSISYQTNPVLGEFSKPLLAGEYLYPDPVTYGSDYMELLINDRNDNGYFTHGIPTATNNIQKLYDTPSYSWGASTLLTTLNQGNSFIHHLGHANTGYMMRLYTSSITNANFASVNGITHNFQLLYTQGCYDGAFDAVGGCIAAKAVSIDNFLVAGIFNSRYGWFNQGTTDGPSQHLEREFVSAVYNDTLAERHLGTAHMISKIKTAPWISLPGEFEPGAQLWCHYCCNVFGDPALLVRTGEPTSFSNIIWTGNIDSDWNKPGNWNLAKVPTTLNDVIIPATQHVPVITTVNTTFCHDINILNGGNLTILPGKSMVVYGNVIMNGE
jgi:hypothetical protein